MTRKNIAAAAIIIVSISAALIIFISTGNSDSGIKGYEGQSILLKCSAPACGFVQEMSKTEYFQTIKDKYNNEEKPFKCTKCGGSSLRALKCEKCGEVFVRGAIRNDYADRCPKCRFSPSEAGS